MAWFRKKNPEGKLGGNLRRRFHHLMLSKRRETVPQTRFARPKRTARPMPSAKLVILRKLAGFILAAGIGIGLLYTAFFSNFFNITKVTVEKKGNGVAASALSPFLDKLRGKNILFVNSEKLSREIEQTFKNEILFVRVKKSYPHKVVLIVEEYSAVLNLNVITPEKNQKFILNQIGYAIFENSEDDKLPTLDVRSQKPFTGKSAIIPKEKLDMMVLAFQKFQDLFGMKAPEGEWKKIERELHLKTEKNFFVWLDLTADIEQQLGKLKRTLAKLDIYREPLEYIDLRIAGAESEKVIYKRRK